MNLASNSWSQWIGRGALAGIVLCGPIANAQPPAPPAGSDYCHGDRCATNAAKYGYYETRWRRWPEVARALEPAPAKPAGEKPATKLPSPEKPEATAPKSPADELPLTPPPPPAPQQPIPDVDLPPKPPEPMTDTPLTPAEPITPLEQPVPSRREAPVEPDRPQPEPQPQPQPQPTPQPVEPAATPPTPPPADLPQPSLEEDLLKVLPQGQPSAPRGKAAPKAPETKPPTKSRLKEDPFIDEPLPGEKPPVQPRQGFHPLPNQPRGADLGGAGPNHLQWGAEDAEEVRAAVPAAMFRIESPREAPPKPAIAIAEPRPVDRQVSNVLREVAASREANASQSNRANPLRRAAPSNPTGIGAAFSDRTSAAITVGVGGDFPDPHPQTANSAAPVGPAANPLR
jgi:hypothetical protein